MTDTPAPVAQPLRDALYAQIGATADHLDYGPLLAAARSVPDNAALREALDGAAMTVEAMDIDREMPGETLTPRDRAVFARARRLAVERIRHSIASGGGSVEVDVERLREIYGRIFAALAAAPASPAGLDVDILREAIYSAETDDGVPMNERPRPEQVAAEYGRIAREVAERYAALASPKEASPAVDPGLADIAGHECGQCRRKRGEASW